MVNKRLISRYDCEMDEAFFIPIICKLLLGGAYEVHQPYTIDAISTEIEIDCVTDTHAIEIGLDKRSSRDSVHQALFAAQLTGLKPKVIVINRDRQEGQFEYQIETAAKLAGVEYEVVSENFLLRWQMTNYLRNYPKPKRSVR